jgi:hypothetical protein
MEYHGKLYGKIGRRFIPLSLTSEEVDEAMRQNARIPRSGLALAELLARHGIIQEQAIEDANNYDGGVTLDKIYAAHAEIVAANADEHATPHTTKNED